MTHHLQPYETVRLDDDGLVHVAATWSATSVFLPCRSGRIPRDVAAHRVGGIVTCLTCAGVGFGSPA